MPAPLAKGLIIAASVLVAAGIAIYESPQVRQWVDQSRRKIAVALHSLGDDMQPRRNSESSDDFEARKQELARRRRNELVRRAREEGVAVDLDELARIGREEVELTETRDVQKRAGSGRSFDDLVGMDGMLKKTDADIPPTATTSGTETKDENTALRNRSAVVAGAGAGAGAASFAAGAALAAGGNPFSDDNILFDHDTESPSPSPEQPTRESSATLQQDTPSPSAQLIDLTPESIYLHPDQVQATTNPWAHNSTTTSSSSNADADEADQAAQSFYSFTSDPTPDNESESFSTGTLTPRSTTSSAAFTGASIIGSQASDIAILESMNHHNDSDVDVDARSEIFSESGFTEAGFSEVGAEDDGAGVMTPNSWTDVGSDDESEWGGVGAGGQVSQYQQQVVPQ